MGNWYHTTHAFAAEWHFCCVKTQRAASVCVSISDRKAHIVWLTLDTKTCTIATHDMQSIVRICQWHAQSRSWVWGHLLVRTNTTLVQNDIQFNRHDIGALSVLD